MECDVAFCYVYWLMCLYPCVCMFRLCTLTSDATTELQLDALQLRCCYAVVVTVCGRQLGSSQALNSVFDTALRVRLFELVALWCKEGYMVLNAARPEGKGSDAWVRLPPVVSD